MKLLLVEDSDVSRAAFANALRNYTHTIEPTVEMVGTLRDAEQIADRCDVLVLDLTLPDADPEQMMAFAERQAKLKPVIIISGTADREHIKRAGACGISYLPKSPERCSLAEGLQVELWRAEGALEAKRHRRALDKQRRELLETVASALGQTL